MVGSDLEDDDQAGTIDLQELIDGYYALSDNQEVEVVVAFGGANKDGWRGIKFADMYQLIEDDEDWEFGNETGPDAYLYHDPNADMDDEDSLKLFLDYIRDGYANFDLRFLTFWDHGDSYRGFGGDSSDGHPYNDSLSMDEIASAFERSQAGKFDLIGFDACLMASVEVAKVVEPHADYMIASEDLEPGHGWLWSDVIRLYAEESDIIEAGIGMVDNFVQDVHGSEDDGKTLSLLDLSQYDQLTAALNPVLLAYDQNLLSSAEYSDSLVYGSSVVRSYGATERGDSRGSIDLMHFAQLLANPAPDVDTSANLNELMDAIEEFVVYSKHDGTVPNSFGIAIDAPENTDSEYDNHKISTAWLGFQEAYEELRQNDSVSPGVVADFANSDGVWATIYDEHLAEVTGIYGFVDPVAFEDGSVEDYFMVVAELEAHPTETEGEYFFPAWDQWWFMVEYDPSQPTAWIPASYVDWFEDDGQEYTLYEAEIDFYPAGESVYDFGVLTLIVDEYMEVVGHDIQTYQEFEDGEVRFDKASYQIIPGDAIQFYSFGFNLDDPAYDDWFEASDVITFTQEPVFQSEYLAFEDESGQVFDYEYGIWAEDASGNAILYGPFPAIPRMAVYEDPLGYFEVKVPAGWIAEDPDTSNYEVLRASEPNGNGSVSIYATDDTGLSLTEYADVVESSLNDIDAQDIALTYYEDLPEGWFEYVIENTANFWLFHVFDDGTVVDMIYTFPADLSEANRDLAYRSFDSFSTDSQ